MVSSEVYSLSIKRKNLSDQEVNEMFSLFERYYDNVSRRVFIRDLDNKNWVVLLKSSHSNGIVGFSTLAFYQSLFKDQPVGVVYSGDTIIDRPFWGTPELPRTWLKTVLEVGAVYPQPLYWLLISSGYKTYRYLSVFYKDFYPHYASPSGEEIKDLMEHLAKERFGDEYLPELGIVRFKDGATPLKNGVADVDQRRLKDPHVKFFVEQNPGYINGDELVCITVIDKGNLSPAGKRLLR
jgi:hypothetical protein